MIPEGLNYICDGDKKGIIRKPRGRGYEYFNQRGEKITNEDDLKRIKELVIPPNWKEVWICQDPFGHLQATGQDQKGRKQYLYHDKYSEYRQKSKYRQLKHFGEILPVIRNSVNKDLSKDHWPKEKVLALIVKVLDEYHFRIGNRQYLKSNETYGVTTLRRKHISDENDKLIIEYKAKSGKYRKVNITQGRLRNLIKETSDLPGYEVFRFLDENGKYRNIDSQDVNTYIKEIANEEFTAKDFRTWGGTVTTLEVSAKAKKEVRENPRKKLETSIIKEVAKRLGNTVSTCREYYVHPKVLDTVLKKDIEQISDEVPDEIRYQQFLRKNERKVLHIINS